MDLLNSGELLAFRQAINNASDTFNKHVITWCKLKKKLEYDGDERNPPTFLGISLNCLLHFNYLRIWPANRETETGEVDKESLVIILNRDYLNGLGYINAAGDFAFNPEFDYFVILGRKYRPAGDTPTAQGLDDPLLFYLIVTPYLTATGKEVHEPA